jgi:ParB family transcriptional regulator, chromosome partitioning protein
METKRKALGRGLEQLFSNEILNIDNIDKLEKTILENTDKKDIIEVNLSELRSNPYQPRKVFEEDKLKELSQSINQFGVLEPIIIKKSIRGYEIVAGERRAKASAIAGKKTIPAIIKDFTDNEMMQISVLENIQREDLTSIEEAQAYKNMLVKLEITQEELAKRVGKSRSHITNMLGLLRLPDSVQKMVLEKQITMGHAKVLSKLEDINMIEKLAKKVVLEDINVRKLEEIVQNPDFSRKVQIKKKTSSNKYKYIQEALREKIGTSVRITDKSINIPFDSEKDLQRILDIIKIKIDM